MLRLTKLTDYGVALMTCAARRPSNQIFTSAAIAEDVGLPLPTVSKLLKQLSKANLLDSQRGAHGGYRLARPAEDISVAELIAALEGPVAMTECTSESDPECGLAATCAVRSHWQIINQRIVATLSEVSLAEMAAVAPGAESLPMVSSQ